MPLSSPYRAGPSIMRCVRRAADCQTALFFVLSVLLGGILLVSASRASPGGAIRFGRPAAQSPMSRREFAARMAKVKEGMTPEQVTARLGEPDRIAHFTRSEG